MEIKPIGYVRTDFGSKFGVPRQSGLAPSLSAVIEFEPEYRMAEAFKELENYEYIWILWQFSEVPEGEWSPTCRPPRLGGNKRVGVFASRTPFRPNRIGLSSVRLDRVEHTKDRGTLLHVSGADVVDGTPVFDVKPYIAYADSHPNAKSGFVDAYERKVLQVVFCDEALADFPGEKVDALREVLAADPRPSYQSDPDRVYGFVFAGFEVKFKVAGEVLTVLTVARS
ncbi:MAG: tRNA (N6-threonylcarbamoyladenosine(37)-N6)-methyltransferase TrmO [Paludibacteraceae bacterium]|nr:tRNA (N6-threonylcarbamoyladenosine(37)-N6)-methyltransferase TrmO [Paludibacteraceae bacterium]MBP5742552.1 tRNA (N6-threonylcarbamoyladenosine(37)-N6)-methyltransferase TrmO [Paludibacteraceae bacterium]